MWVSIAHGMRVIFGGYRGGSIAQLGAATSFVWIDESPLIRRVSCWPGAVGRASAIHSQLAVPNPYGNLVERSRVESRYVIQTLRCEYPKVVYCGRLRPDRMV